MTELSVWVGDVNYLLALIKALYKLFYVNDMTAVGRVRSLCRTEGEV